METKKKIYVLLGILTLLGLTFQAGRYSKAAKVEVVTKEVIKEVIKEVVVKNDKRNQTTIVDKTTNRDGTTTEHTTIVDRGTTDTTTSTDTNRESTKSSSTTTTRDSGLTIEAFAMAKINDLSGDRVYGAGVSKRIFGNLRAGIMGTTDKKIGITLGLDF